MILSDTSIKRPVVALVASIVIVILGTLSFMRLPVREYPSTDTAIVTVRTDYRGASAEVVETKITEPIEKEIATIQGIRNIQSTSQEEYSSISVEFNLGRDIDQAANDVRDRMGRARRRLPEGIDEPRIEKADNDSSPVITLSFNSDRFTRLELVELVERMAIQRIQTVPGVGSVSIRGPRFAMRLWIDSDRLAAYQLTIIDIENALREQNVEVPSGRIESDTREFPVRMQGRMEEVSDFENLVIVTRGDYQVKITDIGRVELGSEDYRSETYFNGNPTVSVSIVRQSDANLVEVANGVKAALPSIRADMPSGVNVQVAFDNSVFVERSVREVYQTLIEAACLVVLVIFLFLRDWRATLIPLVAIPVSLIGTFSVMAILGFSINILTLLALVLAVGLVVDDAIVVLENIYRRMELGEKSIQAAIFGTRQVAFAVIATTLSLAAVFLPVAFQSGQVGRLFYEFGITLAVSVLVSAFVALTLTPMLCSRLLKAAKIDTASGKKQHGWLHDRTEPFFVWFNRRYEGMLRLAMKGRWLVLLFAIAYTACGLWLYTQLQRELAPAEDRGVFSTNLIAPIGSTPEYLRLYSYDMEQMVLKIPEVDRTFHRTGDGGRAYVYATLKPWEQRTRKTQQITAILRQDFQREVTGGQATISAMRGFGGSRGSGVRMVLQGSEFDELQRIGALFVRAMQESGKFVQPRVDPSPTKPQLQVRVDRGKAADLRVRISDIATTLESLLGSRRVTEFQRGNQQYYVMVQVESENRATPADLARLYVRSADGYLVQLSNLVTWTETAVAENYRHFDRMRSVVVSSQLMEGSTLGDAIDFLTALGDETLPAGYAIAWDGETREFKESGNDTYMLFGLALLFTFLILAAQFESWIHPATIFTGVLIAIAGGLMVLWSTRFWNATPMTDNLFSRFGLIMLIGLVTKNGILIVEFANQLQIEGKDAFTAVFQSATIRFRPILMTAISTVLGAAPIAFATGAGAEARNPMGIVVVGGLTISTVMTLFVIPIIYLLMDRVCVKLTGRSSAYGLKQAAEIDRETRALAASGPLEK